LNKPKVVLLATGGTIASRYDPALGRTVASAKAEDLLRALPQVGEVADLEIDNFATIPSFDMTLAFAFELATRVNAALARPDVTGAVVTHGTDTMEETSWLADLLLQSDKPVVFTGAQKAADDPHSDGPPNLLNAVRIAAAPQARELGAVIAFNGQIHAARDVTKVHTSAVETFQSYERGALGAVDGSAVVIHRRPTLRRTFQVKALEERVDIFRLSLGADLSALQFMIDRGVRGLVIEGFGRGNGPTALTPLVRTATQRGIPVLISSRCPVGRVAPIYGGGGGGRDIADAGGIFSGDLKGPKARMLLSVLLGAGQSREQIAETVAALAP
jgi:L-asparaginase